MAGKYPTEHCERLAVERIGNDHYSINPGNLATYEQGAVHLLPADTFEGDPEDRPIHMSLPRQAGAVTLCIIGRQQAPYQSSTRRRRRV